MKNYEEKNPVEKSREKPRSLIHKNAFDDALISIVRDAWLTIWKKWGQSRAGLIGLNPAIAEMLVGTFGPENVFINDLDRKTINHQKFGVTLKDGRPLTEAFIRASGVAHATGTTLGNDTFEPTWNLICKHLKKYLVYGVTAAGVSYLMKIDRICPYD